MDYAKHIAEQLNLGVRQVEKTIELLESGATVPFVARYRKEATGNLNEVQIAAILNKFSKLRLFSGGFIKEFLFKLFFS